MACLSIVVYCRKWQGGIMRGCQQREDGAVPLKDDGTMMRQGHSSLNAAISESACARTLRSLLSSVILVHTGEWASPQMISCAMLQSGDGAAKVR